MPRIAPLELDSAPESVRQLLSPERPNKIALLFGHAETNWPRLAARLSPREVVELLLAAGVYEALAKLMNALDLESEGPIDPDFARAVNAGSVERTAAMKGER